MNWQQLLRSHRVQTHVTSHRELEGFRAVVERDLKDAHVLGLSTDRQFATAYNAVLQLAKMAIACARYRVVGAGHHRTTFEAIELALGARVTTLASCSLRMSSATHEHWWSRQRSTWAARHGIVYQERPT